MLAAIVVLTSKLTRSHAGRLVAFGVACLFGGAVAFEETQHVTFGTALYWAITTATTVGYGDVTPKNASGRVVASIVMLTTIPLFASAFALFAGTVASARLRRLFGMERQDPAEGGVVIFGTNPAVPPAVSELLAAGRNVAVVTTADRSQFPDGATVVAADPRSEEGVRRGRPERAEQVLIAGEDDAAVLVTALLVHQAAPGTPSLAIASAPDVCSALRELGIDAVSGDELLAHAVAKSLEAPHAGELLLRILDSEGVRLQELPVGSRGDGRPLSALRGEEPGLVIGAVRDGRVVMGIADDPVLEADDRLLVLRPDAAGREARRSDAPAGPA